MLQHARDRHQPRTGRVPTHEPRRPACGDNGMAPRWGWRKTRNATSATQSTARWSRSRLLRRCRRTAAGERRPPQPAPPRERRRYTLPIPRGPHCANRHHQPRSRRQPKVAVGARKVHLAATIAYRRHAGEVAPDTHITAATSRATLSAKHMRSLGANTSDGSRPGTTRRRQACTRTTRHPGRAPTVAAARAAAAAAPTVVRFFRPLPSCAKVICSAPRPQAIRPRHSSPLALHGLASHYIPGARGRLTPPSIWIQRGSGRTSVGAAILVGAAVVAICQPSRVRRRDDARSACPFLNSWPTCASDTSCAWR